eukprot:Gb_19341 [translate_table: standard]
MASFMLSMPVGNVLAAANANVGEKKGFFDWLNDQIVRDQLVETDPVLKKVEENNGSARPSARATPAPRKKGSSPPPPKKSGPFGGFFGKK